MTEQKLDEILKDVYQKDGTVPREWNQKLREKQKERCSISGRGTLGGEIPGVKFSWHRHHGVAVAAVLLCCIVGIPVSVYAYFHYMTPAGTAQEMGMDKLAVRFGQQKDQEQSVSMKGYRISYLGMVTGRNLAEGLEGAEVDEEKTYIVTAIQKENGEAMTYGDRFFVGPLIGGLEPVHYNVAARGSSAICNISNGIQYRISECDTIGIFAGRDLYLAVQEGDFLSAEAYTMDKETGVITANRDYEKVNALFSIRLDPGMADEEKASAYIAEMEKELEGTADGNGEKSGSKGRDGSDLVFPSGYTAEYGDVIVNFPIFGSAHRANDIEFNAFGLGEKGTLDIDFRPSVQGKGIRDVTFDVEGGKFYEVEELTGERAEDLREKAFKVLEPVEEVTEYARIYDEVRDDADDALWYGMLKKGETTTIRIPGKKNRATAHYVLRITKTLEDDESAKKQQKELTVELEKLKIRMKIEKEDGTVIEKQITCHATQYYFNAGTKDKNLAYDHYYYEYEIQ